MYSTCLYRMLSLHLGKLTNKKVAIAIIFSSCCFPAFGTNANFPAQSEFEQSADGDPFVRINEIRQDEISNGSKNSIFGPSSEPLHSVWTPFAQSMQEKGWEITFQYTAMLQYSDDKIDPSYKSTLSGGDADLAIKWNAYNQGDDMAGYFRVSLEHRHPYGTTPPAYTGSQIGSLWLTVRGWNEYDGVAITEGYWHQGTSSSTFEYRIGRVKNTTIWNAGKYIGGNDGFVGGEVTGTPALITLSSAWSANATYHPVGGNTHLMGGVFQANVDNQELTTFKWDELIYAVQFGWKPELSAGNGRYTLFAWHVDETDKTSDANGFAINLEQNFEQWTPFFRYSFGDQDRSDSKSHEIRQHANIGLGYNSVFNRSKDWIAIAATWAEPTDSSLRDQYGLELNYKFKLTPHSTLTPHIQWIHNPSLNVDSDSAMVLGVRAKIEF